jgi:hypothetical protein
LSISSNRLCRAETTRFSATCWRALLLIQGTKLVGLLLQKDELKSVPKGRMTVI